MVWTVNRGQRPRGLLQHAAVASCAIGMWFIHLAGFLGNGRWPSEVTMESTRSARAGADGRQDSASSCK